MHVLKEFLCGGNPAKKTAIYRDMTILVAVFLLLIPILAIYRVTDFMIFCIFAMSFDLLYGYMGRLSFGHVLYQGTGVYVSTLFSIHVNTNPLLSMLAGIFGGAILAGVLGLIVVNLEEAPFALVLTDLLDPRVHANVTSRGQVLADSIHARHPDVVRVLFAPVAPVPRAVPVEFLELRRPIGDDLVPDQRLQELAKGRRSRGKELGAVIELVVVCIARRHAATDATRLLENRDLRDFTETPRKD